LWNFLDGCSSAAPAPVEPTPNIDATVEARVAQERVVDATVEARLAQERTIDARVEARAKELVAAQVTNIPTSTPIPPATPLPAPTATQMPVPTATPSPTATTSADSYFDKGMEYYDSENWSMAIEQFTKAIQLDPDFADAYYARGIVYLLLGQDSRAAADETEACSMGSRFC